MYTVFSSTILTLSQLSSLITYQYFHFHTPPAFPPWYISPIIIFIHSSFTLYSFFISYFYLHISGLPCILFSNNHTTSHHPLFLPFFPIRSTSHPLHTFSQRRPFSPPFEILLHRRYPPMPFSPFLSRVRVFIPFHFSSVSLCRGDLWPWVQPSRSWWEGREWRKGGWRGGKGGEGEGYREEKAMVVVVLFLPSG